MLKNVYCLGTSYTEGGGFEFSGKDFKLARLYDHLGIGLNQFNFSWPGQLQSLLGNDIKIHNLAKSGYGNERIHRVFFDLIEQKDNISKDSIFLFEIASLGRKEYYLNDLNEHIICNYSITPGDDTGNMIGIASTYFYDTPEITKTIIDNEELFNQFIKKTINFNIEHKLYERNFILLLSFLELHNFKYFILGNLNINPKYNRYIPDYISKTIWFPSKTNKTKKGDFVQFFNEHNLTLTEETKGVIKDGHSGYVGNKITAEIIYNHLIDMDVIDSTKVELTDYTKDYIFEPTGKTPMDNFLEPNKLI